MEPGLPHSLNKFVENACMFVEKANQILAKRTQNSSLLTEEQRTNNALKIIRADRLKKHFRKNIFFKLREIFLVMNLYDGSNLSAVIENMSSQTTRFNNKYNSKFGRLTVEDLVYKGLLGLVFKWGADMLKNHQRPTLDDDTVELFDRYTAMFCTFGQLNDAFREAEKNQIQFSNPDMDWIRKSIQQFDNLIYAVIV